MDFSDYQLARMIETARFLLKLRTDWYANLPENAPYTPCPAYYWNYLQLKGVITDFMKKRRQHRKAVNHIWKVYANSVIEARKKNES
jgi:hypothetical protein